MSIIRRRKGLCIDELDSVDVCPIIKAKALEIMKVIKTNKYRGDNRLKSICFAVYMAGIELGIDYYMMIGFVARKCNVSCGISCFKVFSPSYCIQIPHTIPITWYLASMLREIRINDELYLSIMTKVGLLPDTHTIFTLDGKNKRNAACAILYYGCISRYHKLVLEHLAELMEVDPLEISKYEEMSLSIFS